jgi:Flp pilus assembly protein TadG
MQRASDPKRGERGFTLMTAGVCAVVIVGVLGLAVDLGRIFVARGEGQTFADSAALAAVLELDGTGTGLDRAREKVASNINRFQLGSRGADAVVTEFSTSAAGPWSTNPASAVDVRFIRVQPRSDVSSYFVQVFGGSSLTGVRAPAVAGAIAKDTFREGSFPFSPLAHSAVGPDFGLVPGQIYTLRWASNPKLNVNSCAGDNAQNWIDQAQAGGGDERGFIEETSSSNIRQAIEADYQTIIRDVGDSVIMTGGAKQTQVDSIRNRVNQDTNSAATTYAEYAASGTGNGRRMIIVPVNTYHPDYTIVGFRAFFLLKTSEYGTGGNKPFCAEYVGAYTVGSKHKGAGTSGAYVSRLVE